ncbi:MAG TPA: YsnF/AvaK domain-containing protein [Pyrinomonadaceae bacterium]|nr:YsnF/AvaK domain-containing protein [Pyrinomonadaceae bacterium]
MANTTGTTQKRSQVITGMFRDRDSAERAYSSLSERGYSKDDINVIMSDETRNKYYPEGSDAADTELGSKALEGTGKGAAIGGTTGAILGAIAAIGTSVALPGLGLLVAGPLAGALVGAGAGGAAGGLIGAMVGSGIPEDRAKEYEAGVKEGGIVMGFNPRSDEDAEYFEQQWNSDKAEGVYRGETTIPVVEEELQVGKREVERGGVRVESRVEEKPVTEQVQLREERVHVERRPVDRPVTDADNAFREGSLEVTERAEEAVVSKTARVVEEVVVGKQVEEHTETVRDTVRRTDVDVQEVNTTDATRTDRDR